MPDAEHAPDFWRSVADEYRDDRAVLFDLYNEPHDVGWDCWEHGCEIDDELVRLLPGGGDARAGRSGALDRRPQPLMLGGIDWARDLSGWLAHLPPTRPHALVASNHTYDFTACYRPLPRGPGQDREALPGRHRRAGRGRLPPRLHRPLHALGRSPRHLLPRLGLVHRPGLDLQEGPTLITDYEGTPTAFGIGFRDHLRQLHAEGSR